MGMKMDREKGGDWDREAQKCEREEGGDEEEQSPQKGGRKRVRERRELEER